MEKMLIKYKADDRYPYPLNKNNLEGDAGIDLRSMEDVNISSGEYITLGTGLYMEIPEGMVGLVCPRSGLAVNYGLSVILGIIDCGYRGEINVTLVNHDKNPFEILKGTRIAQLVIVPSLFASSDNFCFKRVDTLSDTQRGTNGFGSTGM